MLFCYFLINILKMNASSDNEKESQEVLLTSNKRDLMDCKFLLSSFKYYFLKCLIIKYWLFYN